MTRQELKAHAKKVIATCTRKHYSGAQWEIVCLGVHPDQRGELAVVLAELIKEGAVETYNTRVFDTVGNAEEITTYRKRFTRCTFCEEPDSQANGKKCPYCGCDM